MTKRTLPNTKEEGYWWKVGYETGVKDAERKNEMYIRVGKPIIDAICDMGCTTSND